MMSLRENNQDILIAFLEREYEQHQTLQNYYQKQLADLKEDKKPTPLSSPVSTPLPTPKPNKHKTGRLKTEEVSIMEESAISINSQSPSKKGEKKEAKREVLSFEMEYQLLSKQIGKLIDTLSNKDNTSFKKTPSVTPKRPTTNRSTIRPTPNVPEFKMNLSAVSASKTERQQSSNQEREQLLNEIGDTALMVSNDEVVMKLISNLRIEEERFVDALLLKSKMSARNKMKNYLQHLIEKNQETIFKLKQNAIDRSLSRIQSNKETVRSGYTLAMKELIQKALRGKATAQL